MTSTVQIESPPTDPRWLAVLARDSHADGTFWYAVRTTRVYCRPSCPSRHARVENVSFYGSPEDARTDGYRPCRRCHPDEIGAHQRLVAHIQQLLDTAYPTPTLAELGEATGLSPFHLQKVFKRITGLSPKQYAMRARTDRLKGELREGTGVTAALYGAGHPSSRTLYDPATDQLGMSPVAYQRGGVGQTIAYALTDSPLGRLLVAATARGLCAVRFGDDATLVGELRAEYPKAALVEDEPGLAPYVEALRIHLMGRQSWSLPTDVSASDFQRCVWEALGRIPYGETRSYAQVAEMIGRPSAVRAVARACASNPLALVVPCHRVVRTGGQLGGYRWGMDRKQSLLDQERTLAAE